MNPSQQPTPEQLAQMPVAPPPPGVASNFVDPPTTAPMAYGVMSLALVIMVSAVTMRFYTRAVVVKSFGADDWSCVVAVILTLWFNIVGYVLFASEVIGRHAWDIPMINYLNFGKLFLVNQPIYPLAFLAIKSTILLLIIRVFGPNNRSRYLAYGGLVTMSLFYIISFILTLVWCAPAPGEQALITVMGRHCQSWAQLLSNGQAAFNLISDVYIIAIPMPVIKNLNRSIKRKFGLVFLFALGLVATALSAFTLYERVTYVGDPWKQTDVEIATIFEMDMGLTCACLPCIPAIMKTAGMKHLFSSGGYWSRLRSRATPVSKSNERAASEGNGRSIENISMHLLKNGGSNGRFHRVDSLPRDSEV